MAAALRQLSTAAKVATTSAAPLITKPKQPNLQQLGQRAALLSSPLRQQRRHASEQSASDGTKVSLSSLMKEDANLKASISTANDRPRCAQRSHGRGNDA